MAHNTESGTGNNPDGRKGPGGDWFADGRQGQDACAEGIKGGGYSWSGSDKPGYVAKGLNTEAAKRYQEAQMMEFIAERGVDHLEGPGLPDGTKQHGSGAEWWDKALDERRKEATARKNGGDWFGPGANCSEQRKHGSKSNSRKAASALIARIPEPLSHYVAESYFPERLLESEAR